MSENHSEILQPRRIPPVGHGVQAIARVQPLVPEVSMFVTSDQHLMERDPKLTVKPLVDRQPLGTLNGQQFAPSPPPPAPAKQPTVESFKATSEFSRVFADNGLSVMSLNPSAKAEPKPEAKDDKLDVYNLISWQNEQLVQLQRQVNELLSRQSSESSPNLADSWTQTSAPPSPTKRSVCMNTVEKDPPVVRPLEDAASLPLGASAARVLEPNGANGMAFAAETAPCNEREKIVCKDLIPPQDINGMIDKVNEAFRRQRIEPPEPSMIGRLKDLGVSFVKPSDLDGKVKHQVSVWHPTAAEPSIASATESTSDFSLMLNSAALKYLSDEQLSHVARLHHRRPESDLTTYGMPEGELSVATKEFLDRNHLKK